MIRVNGELLNPDLIEETFSAIKSAAERRSQASCCERDEEWMQQAEDEVVDSVLIAQAAEESDLVPPESDVAAALETLVRSYREQGASWEMLEEQKDDLRSEVVANLRMESYLAKALPAERAIPEAELRNYYESRSKEYRSPVEARCLHLIKLIDSSDDQRELLESMTALRQRLLAGEDFLLVAREETEKSGGEVDLGWIPLDRPTNPFETILFSLREGEVSPVISYEHALHLIKVTARRGGVPPAFETIRDEVQSRHLQEARQEAIRAVAKELRTKAKIEQVSFSGDTSQEPTL